MKNKDKSNNPYINLVAVGDIMLTRTIGDFIRKNGADLFFKYVKDTIKNSDIAFANLETPLTTRGKPIPGNDPNVTFRSHPSNAKVLKELGFNILSLANNHILDYGKIGLEDTLNFLKCNDIKSIGAGLCEEEAYKEIIIEKNDIKIGVNAFHQLLGPSVKDARKNKPGVAQLLPKNAIGRIKQLKQKVDVVITSIHWGMDYHRYPSPYDIQLAHTLVNAGCDLILGHHPHVLQGYEKYNNAYIFYSLGNFIFDDPNPLTTSSVILKFCLSKNGIASVDFLPVVANENHQPVITPQLDKDNMLELQRLTDEYKSQHWIGKTDKDPTDKLILHAIKILIRRGRYAQFRSYPLSVLAKRVPPLFCLKFMFYFKKIFSIISKKGHTIEDITRC